MRGWRRSGGLVLLVAAVAWAGSADAALCRHKKTGALRIRPECKKRYIAVDVSELGIAAATGGGLALGTSGLALAPGGVTTDKLADGVCTEDKLADAAVTPAKVGTRPAARVYNSANQSIPGDASFTTLAFDTERFDTADLHDGATNNSRLTAPIAGLYLVSADISWEGNNTGARELAINKNTSTIVARNVVAPTPSPNTTEQSITTLVQLAAGDFVEVVLRQNSASALNVFMAAQFSPEFSMVWVGP
jgi:hypothetical protein